MSWARRAVCMAAVSAVPALSFQSAASALEVGGHVGVAVPLVEVSHKTTTVADQPVIATPFGIGLKITDKLTLDFETVVLTPVAPSGGMQFIVDPGFVYNLGPCAIGLRLARKINANSNIGAIPLINMPLIKAEHTTWFVEAAFPIFYENHHGSFTSVLHTGLGF